MSATTITELIAEYGTAEGAAAALSGMNGCGRLTAIALVDALQAEGWQRHFVGATFPNYDRMSGQLRTSHVSSAHFWHPDRDGVVYSVTYGCNERAGTAWGSVATLSGEALEGALASIRADSAKEKARVAEQVRVDALPEGMAPGLRDQDLHHLRNLSQALLYGDASPLDYALYGSDSLTRQFEQAREAMLAAERQMLKVYNSASSAESMRRIMPETQSYWTANVGDA